MQFTWTARMKALFDRRKIAQVKLWLGGERDNILRTHADIRREADRYGRIKVVRFDRDLGKVVEEEVTRGMPERELV